jgi:minor histocompatibility antigen H13
VLASEDEAAAAQEAVASTVDASNSTNGTNATLWEQCTSLDELVVMLKKGADEMEPGLAMAYAALVTMAALPILFGSFKSIGVIGGDSAEEIEIMTSADAAMFPVYASCALFSLFLLFKFFGKEYINLVMGGYFFLLGSGALTTTLRPLGELLSPKSFQDETYELTLKSGLKKKENAEESGKGDEEKVPTPAPLFHIQFDQVDLVCLAMASVVGVWWICTKHWIATNLYGLSFSLTGISLFCLPSYTIGAMLLSGLFFYDIFWVFCTPVMVTVAKSFDAPIKVLFPKDLVENGFMAANQHAMLGLGDIVLPGVVIALLCRFDHRRVGTAGIYFYATYVSYILGLIFTIVVMHTFKAAQPALLYLVPAVLLTPLTIAIVRGELFTKDVGLLTYDESPEEEETEESKKKN